MNTKRSVTATKKYYPRNKYSRFQKQWQKKPFYKSNYQRSSANNPIVQTPAML